MVAITSDVPEHSAHQQGISQRACPGWIRDIAALNRLNHGERAAAGHTVEHLLLQLRNTNVHMRLAAIRSLMHVARNGDQQVVRELLGQTISGSGFGVQDKASEVRALAAEAVGKIAADTGDRTVCEKMLDLIDDKDWAVRSSALKVKALLPSFLLHPDRSDWQSLSAVCSQGGGWVVDELTAKMMASESWSAKALCAEGLGNVCIRGTGHVVNALIEMSRHDDWAVRKVMLQVGESGSVIEGVMQACLLALAKIAQQGDQSVLRDADWRVRKAAVQALGQVAERGCRFSINEILLRLDDTAVGERHSKLDVINHDDRDVKLAAVWDHIYQSLWNDMRRQIKVLEKLANPGDHHVLAALDSTAQRISGDSVLLAAIVRATTVISHESLIPRLEDFSGTESSSSTDSSPEWYAGGSERCGGDDGALQCQPWEHGGKERGWEGKRWAKGDGKGMGRSIVNFSTERGTLKGLILNGGFESIE
eukprot:762747-Hanusia_phi.AAC.3